MKKYYSDSFKKKMVFIYLTGERTFRSLEAEYGASKSSIAAWTKKFCNEYKDKKLY